MSSGKGRKMKKIDLKPMTQEEFFSAAHKIVGVPYVPDSSLLCQESLGQPREERDYQAAHPINLELEANRLQVGRRRKVPINMDLTADDVKLVNDLGQLSTEQLADYIRIIQANAYNVACDEARQISKGKVLHIFKKPVVTEEEEQATEPSQIPFPSPSGVTPIGNLPVPKSLLRKM